MAMISSNSLSAPGCQSIVELCILKVMLNIHKLSGLRCAKITPDSTETKKNKLAALFWHSRAVLKQLLYLHRTR